MIAAWLRAEELISASPRLPHQLRYNPLPSLPLSSPTSISLIIEWLLTTPTSVPIRYPYHIVHSGDFCERHPHLFHPLQTHPHPERTVGFKNAADTPACYDALA